MPPAPAALTTMECAAISPRCHGESAMPAHAPHTHPPRCPLAPPHLVGAAASVLPPWSTRPSPPCLVCHGCLAASLSPWQMVPRLCNCCSGCTLQHSLERVAGATERPGLSRLRHYFCRVRPSCFSPHDYAMPAYLCTMRERWRRVALAELRTRMHWVAEARPAAGHSAVAAGRA